MSVSFYNTLTKRTAVKLGKSSYAVLCFLQTAVCVHGVKHSLAVEEGSR